MKQIGALLLECVDMGKAKKVLAYSVILPMLENFVKSTDNPYDDKLVVFFKEWAEKALN